MWGLPKQNDLLTKEREKDAKVIQELNIGLYGKDKRITEIEYDITDLNNQLYKQSQEPDEAKSIVLNTY